MLPADARGTGGEAVGNQRLREGMRVLGVAEKMIPDGGVGNGGCGEMGIDMPD